MHANLLWLRPSVIRSSTLLNVLETTKLTGFEQVRRLKRTVIAGFIDPKSSKSKKVPRNEKDAMSGFSSILEIRKALIVRSAIAVFALGFVDAGYSGDWSRIGVISSETEGVLRLASYFVVPICIYLIFTISQEKKKEIP